MPTAAYAQSTGTLDFEKDTIVVTGTRAREVGGVQAPDTPKAKAVLTQEMIARQNPGQTILDTINVVPGVSFQNNDAYGSSGGTLTIRGFDASRISLTFDGVPLNDSGNYAVYSNQQIDPELLEQVNVNLGSTDVDSPTASAVGGTVNLRTLTPSKQMGGRIVGSLGEYDFRRLFGMFQTGEIGPWGTRAWIAASTEKNDLPYNGYGKIDKQQYNGKVWQPVGSNGDFVAIAGHYNQNRNNSNAGLPLRTDLTRTITVGGQSVVVPRIVGSNSQNRYPTTRDERFYNINYPCTVDTPQAGVADTVAPSTGPFGAADPNGDFASCGTEFDRRYNPSNTGNLRGQSRFTLTDGVVLTVDPSYQWVKANGGGTVTIREFGFDLNPAGTTSRANCLTTPNSATVNCVAGYFGGSPYMGGADVNGDGDALDQVTVIAPSQTRTRRVGVIAGLRWDFAPGQTGRIAYTYDRANHRQTGEVGRITQGGEPLDVFPINDPIADANGINLQKRDRQSYAILNKVAAEYRGEFGRFTALVGASMPFFKRDLQNNCFTSSASGFVECTGGNEALNTQAAAQNPYTFNETTGAVTGWSPPGKRVLKYKKFLPNVGFQYDITNQLNVFTNYSKNISVPSTDNLYNAFFFPEGAEQAKPKPETTDSVDAGLRYRSGKIQAQVAVWGTKFNNRLASAYDPELNATVYRNLGRVNKYGIDGSVAYEPIPELTLYLFGSKMRSKIKDNIQIGRFGTGVNQVTDCDNLPAGALASDIVRSCAFTAGNWESGAPKYMWGASAVGRLGPVELGITAKRTGPRYVYDTNTVTFNPGVNLTTLNDANAANDPAVIYGATAPAYWLVNMDARVKLAAIGPELKDTYFQLNVYNLFDKLYVGGFGGGLNQAFNTAATQYGNPSFVGIGAPRTISGTLSIGF